jgi:hypothetical protein
MNPTCINCGALLHPPKSPGALVTCHFCGAPQAVQAQPGPRLPSTAPGPSGSPRLVIAVIALFVVVVVMVGTFARRAALGPHGGLLASRLDVAALANVSLAVTPAAMAAVTHVPVGNNNYMTVPLSGSAFDSVTFQWDEDDLSHPYTFTLSFVTPPPDVAAITRRLRAVLGSQMSASGSYSWQGAGASVTKDYVSAVARVEGKPGPKNPRWKQQLDTLWDVVRAEVLGLTVPVDDDVVRDWLGRGRAPALLASIDPATDVDASAAAVRKVFPGALSEQWSAITYRIALDHPLFDEVALVWENKRGAELETANFHPLNPADKEANQAAFEACLRSAFGPPTWRTETDHVNGKYSSRWSPEGPDNTIEADSGGVFVVVEAFVLLRSGGTVRPGSSRLSTPAWQKVVGVLDACGRH